MTKAKISEYDAVAANNTDVNGVNIAENCPPSGMNNMGREIMAALKRFQTGADGDSVTVGGSLVVSGSVTAANTATLGNVDINGGTIDGTAIGGASAAAGSFTTLNTSGQVVFNDAGADVDFRVESDTVENALFVDGASGSVGIGTSSPNNESGYGNVTINGTTGGILDIKANGSDVFRMYGTATQSMVRTTTATPLLFGTNDLERMRIDSSGNLLVGTTTATGRITGQSSTSDNSSFALGTKNSSSTDLFRVRGDGALYLGLAGSSPYNLTTGSAANAYLETNGYLYRSTSSRKYKTQIEDIDASRSQAILNFRPVWYRSLCKDDNKSWSYYGLIAEEVAEIEPRLVFWGYNENDYEEVTTETPVERERTVTDENGNEAIETYIEVETKTERKLKEDAQLAPEGVQYERLTVFLLDVVKRQDASIKALEARIAALEA